MMNNNISVKLIISVFNNLGFSSTTNENLGEMIELSSKEALLYAISTGHGYLDKDCSNNQFKLTRDFFRIFNQIDCYKFQNGLFTDRGIKPFNNLINITNRKKYLITEKKYILPVETRSFNDLNSKCKEIINISKESDINYNNIIVFPIFIKNNNLSYFESFIEYLIVKYYSNNGFITDTQIPFLYGIGTPDALAFRNFELYHLLNKHGYFSGGGNIIELLFPSIFGFVKGKTTEEKFEDKFFIFEVETYSSAEKQLEKYIKTGYFDSGFEARPFFQNDNYSYFSFNEKGEIIVKIKDEEKNFKKQVKYIKWLTNYVKYYILSNLSNNDFEKFTCDVLKGIDNKQDFVRKVNDIELEDIIEYVAE